LSFFDEADEPRTPPPRTRRPSGAGRRPPGDRQSIQVRRAVAGVAIVIVVILIVLGVHSCQVSARNSSLKDYTNNVASILQESDNTGTQFFNLLSGAGGASNAQNLTNQLNETRVAADHELKHAEAIDVPDEVKNAQSNFLLALTMRRDGIANIAQLVQSALGTTNNHNALNQIAANNARFYASDVLYTDYTATEIAAALHAAGITVGPNGETIPAGQFLPDLGWLSPDFVATKLGASSSSSSSSTSGPVAPGTHGHSLDSVSVGGTTLQSGSTNTIPRSPTPSFTVNFTNSGQNNEKNVVIKVSVSGTSSSGQTVVPQTTAGQSTSATVPLNQSPPAGTYSVTVTVVPVRGETNSANNTQTYPVTFQ
jgi:hypothetical protein